MNYIILLVESVFFWTIFIVDSMIYGGSCLFKRKVTITHTLDDEHLISLRLYSAKTKIIHK